MGFPGDIRPPANHGVCLGTREVPGKPPRPDVALESSYACICILWAAATLGSTQLCQLSCAVEQPPPAPTAAPGAQGMQNCPDRQKTASHWLTSCVTQALHLSEPVFSSAQWAQPLSPHKCGARGAHTVPTVPVAGTERVRRKQVPVLLTRPTIRIKACRIFSPLSCLFSFKIYLVII